MFRYTDANNRNTMFRITQTHNRNKMFLINERKVRTMKKSDMITTIARRASKAWLELSRYEYELHCATFRVGEITSFEFSQYCSQDLVHRGLLSGWHNLDKLCETLGIKYGDMYRTDDVIGFDSKKAAEYRDLLWKRYKH